ncbi:MAG TPA: pyridoxamine 5'-phosphate oxidase family protein, partial [Erysipelotrichaceae bacterium]|nr:pyridoxamine 5'-phosphate oxidase family protein [Erysipelotrichaceae bacterium]
SLISFVASEDLSKIVFATPVKTKKYNYIKDNTAVSLLFDNRSKGISNINDLVALNVIGNAKILKDSQDIDLWSKLLIEKHQYLKDFIMANTSALILIEVEKYSYVTSFQKVSELNIK